MKTRLAVASVLAGFAGLSVSASYAASPSSAYCKNLLASMASKPKAKAMALSSDGKICTAYWGERSQATADKKALAGCQENGERKCSIAKR